MVANLVSMSDGSKYPTPYFTWIIRPALRLGSVFSLKLSRRINR